MNKNFIVTYDSDTATLLIRSGFTWVENSNKNVYMFINDNALTVNISRLRAKLKSVGYEDAIDTRKGMGYILL